GALVSWVFNIGCSGAQSSTLARRLSAGENPTKVIASELPRWNKAGCKVSEGRMQRCNTEIKLAMAPSNKQAFPKCM
ncbi:hypothetical protein DL89DRAFT_224341, partial [Linderina pennispora]